MLSLWACHCMRAGCAAERWAGFRAARHTRRAAHGPGWSRHTQRDALTRHAACATAPGSSPQQSACHCTDRRASWQGIHCKRVGPSATAAWLVAAALLRCAAALHCCAALLRCAAALRCCAAAQCAMHCAASCSTGTGQLAAWALYAWRQIDAAACTRLRLTLHGGRVASALRTHIV